MKPTPKTLALLALAAVLLVLQLVDLGGTRDGGGLPELPAVDGAQVVRIELSDAIDKVVLAPAPDADPEALAEGRGWRLTAPVDAPADARMVRGLLETFEAPVPMDVRIDEGNENAYGLEAGEGVVVELWTGNGDPVVSLTVGAPAPGGSSFVRPSGAETVYRARVGSRDRFPTKASQWRNRVPLGFSHSDVVALTTQPADLDGWTITRDVAADGSAGPWALDPPAEWPLDTDALDVVVERLGTLRAAEVLDASVGGGFDQPAAVATFTLADGTERVLVVGSRPLADAAFVRVDDGDEVYRVPKEPLIPLFVDRNGLRDKTLMSFDVADLDAMGLQRDGRSWLVRQVGGGASWEVVQPANVALDVGALASAARTLASLRGDVVVDRIAPADAGLGAGATRVQAFLVDGTELTLEIGGATQDPRGQPAYFVRRQGRPGILLLRAATVERLLRAFGQG